MFTLYTCMILFSVWIHAILYLTCWKSLYLLCKIMFTTFCIYVISIPVYNLLTVPPIYAVQLTIPLVHWCSQCILIEHNTLQRNHFFFCWWDTFDIRGQQLVLTRFQMLIRDLLKPVLFSLSRQYLISYSFLIVWTIVCCWKRHQTN